jgi:diguanylate cyclase (GGDEF)-like protein
VDGSQINHDEAAQADADPTEASERCARSCALLNLARALAAAGTRSEVARRVAEAVPMVVDCDRVGVYLWDGDRNRLVRHATSHSGQARGIEEAEEWSRAPARGGVLERLLRDPDAEPMFVDTRTGDDALRELFARLGAVSSVLVPLATADSLLGLLTASVMSDPERIAPDPDLRDRLSGVAAQATTALLNRRLVDRIAPEAQHDKLTGLANRRRFTEELRLAVNRARQLNELLTVFHLGLDGLEPVNDELGHEVGDALLVAIGERLNSRMRKGDTVARLGGEEFAVLVDAHTDPPDMARLQQRIADAFAHPFVIHDKHIEIRASIGCAAFPEDADCAEALLRTAAEAMLRCKRGRRALLNGRLTSGETRAAADAA